MSILAAHGGVCPACEGDIMVGDRIVSARKQWIHVTCDNPPTADIPRYLTRLDARRAGCPECGAAPGAPCTGRRGAPREGCHRSRYRKAEALPRPGDSRQALVNSAAVDLPGATIARWTTICPECSEQIVAGDAITRSGDHTYKHALCRRIRT